MSDNHQITIEVVDKRDEYVPEEGKFWRVEAGVDGYTVTLGTFATDDTLRAVLENVADSAIERLIEEATAPHIEHSTHRRDDDGDQE